VIILSEYVILSIVLVFIKLLLQFSCFHEKTFSLLMKFHLHLILALERRLVYLGIVWTRKLLTYGALCSCTLNSLTKYYSLRIAIRRCLGQRHGLQSITLTSIFYKTIY
jgi:hypothetical protein